MFFFLRVVINYNYFQPPCDRFLMIQSIKNYDGTAPSVYKVESNDVGERVAALYGMSFKQQPEAIDYVLIPQELIARVGGVAVPDLGDIPHPLMEERHHELNGLNELMMDLLVGEMMNKPVAGQRMQKSKVRELARREFWHPETGSHARAMVVGRPKWEVLLGQP